MLSNSLQEKIRISADADPVLFHGAIFLQSVLHVIHVIVNKCQGCIRKNTFVVVR